MVCKVFFARGEAGASLLLDNIELTKNNIQLEIALRNRRTCVAHTLTNPRIADFNTSVNDMVAKYDRLHRASPPVQSITGL